MMWQESGGYVQNFKSIRQKIKIFILGGGGLDCGQYQILTDPHNGLNNLRAHFGNDRSIGWEEFDDRQTDKSNPSVPYNTFACFAGLIKIIKNMYL